MFHKACTTHNHSLLPKNAHASSFVLQTLLGYSNKYCISLFLTTCSSLKGEINLMAKSYIYKSFATGGKAILLGLRLRFSKTLQTFLLIYKSKSEDFEYFIQKKQQYRRIIVYFSQDILWFDLRRNK